jgi:hypothetical protein
VAALTLTLTLTLTLALALTLTQSLALTLALIRWRQRAARRAELARQRPLERAQRLARALDGLRRGHESIPPNPNLDPNPNPSPNPNPDPNPDPNQVAYGAKGLNWYCWGGGVYWYSQDKNAPGMPSPMYQTVREVNADASAWG